MSNSMVVPSVLVIEETLSTLLNSINEGSPNACSLKTPIHEMGPTETCRMVQSLELALRSFQDQAHLRLSQYRTHQNAILPPISQLPVEVFSRILFQSVAIHDSSTIPNWSITRLQELAQVAKTWKDVVLGTPELWGVVKVYRRPDINPRWREDLDLVLMRSRSAPLTVIYGIESEGYDDETQLEDMDAVGEIFSRLGGHATRLQTILYDGILCSAVTATLQVPTPSLKRFRVNSWNYEDPWTDLSTLPLRLAPGQKLFHVEAQNVPLIWTDFKGLTSLYLVRVETEKANDRLVEDFLVVLESCPDLESLTLEDIGSITEGESTESVDERSIQGILARSPQIDLPSLQSMKIKNLSPALVLAIVFSVHATGVSTLHLEVGRYFLAALPDFSAGQLIKPAFDKALDRSPKSRLYIVQYCHSLWIQNHGHESWETQPPSEASFELHILVDEEVTEGDALEQLLEFLECSSRSMPVQLELGLGSSISENTLCMLRFPIHILDQVVELRLHGSRTHTSAILLYLSQTTPDADPNSEPTWPCPRLASLWVQHRKWKHILNFLERRYGPRPIADGSGMTRTRLPAITFQFEPTLDVLPRIEPFVERWRFIGEHYRIATALNRMLTREIIRALIDSPTVSL